MHGGTLQNTRKHVNSKTTDQKVSGSNPLGRATFRQFVAVMSPLSATASRLVVSVRRATALVEPATLRRSGTLRCIFNKYARSAAVFLDIYKGTQRAPRLTRSPVAGGGVGGQARGGRGEKR